MEAAITEANKVNDVEENGCHGVELNVNELKANEKKKKHKKKNKKANNEANANDNDNNSVAAAMSALNLNEHQHQACCGDVNCRETIAASGATATLDASLNIDGNLNDASGLSAAAAAAATSPVSELTKKNLDDIRKFIAKSDKFAMERMMSEYCNIAPKAPEDALKKKYHFWETQPVPKFDETVSDHGPLEKKTIESIRKEPYNLVEGFKWDTLDIEDAVVLKELYILLNENYVEDDDNMFRFDYSPEFLKWALKPPHWKQDWHCGVRVVKSNKLVAFISAVPATIRAYQNMMKVVEINFLCVHKKLRSKRMTPVLIKEITRRVNLTGIFQAVYTAGVILPRPVSTCRYWHRSLNPKKLIEVKFSAMSRNMNMQRTIKLYKLPEQTKCAGFRKLESRDIKKVTAMLNEYLKNFDLTPVYTQEEVSHWFLPREKVVDSYVTEVNNQLTGFTSFYFLPSTVMHHQTYKDINAAYSFYNIPSKDVKLQDIMNDALIIAKQAGCDVFNALDLMENKSVLENLKFGIGDGNLQYYLFNWKCPPIVPEKIGLILQ